MRQLRRKEGPMVGCMSRTDSDNPAVFVLVADDTVCGGGKDPPVTG